MSRLWKLNNRNWKHKLYIGQKLIHMTNGGAITIAKKKEKESRELCYRKTGNKQQFIWMHIK